MILWPLAGVFFCIEAYPHKSVGLKDHDKHDKEVQEWVEKMKQMDGRFILLHKPEKRLCRLVSRVCRKTMD